jgi:CRP-like cAMP-binding protein
MISTQTLQFFPLFVNLPTELLEKISHNSHEVKLQPAEYLFEEGEEAKYLYLVKTGSVSLTLKVPDVHGKEFIREMDPMKKGELIGWSSIIGDGYYYFGVVANTPVSLVRVDAKTLKQMMQDHPKEGYQILYQIADVIRDRLEMKCMQLLSLAAA